MALTLPVRMGATVLDGLNFEAMVSAYSLVDPTASFNDIITYWQDWCAAVDACIDGQIRAAALHVYPDLPGSLKSSPLSTSRASQTGLLNFMADADSHRWGFALPSLSNSSAVIAGSPAKIVLTPGHPAHDLISLLLEGPGALEWTNNANQALASFRDCLISFRKHHQQPAPD